jgi:hypothetical protein
MYGTKTVAVVDVGVEKQASEAVVKVKGKGKRKKCQKWRTCGKSVIECATCEDNPNRVYDRVVDAVKKAGEGLPTVEELVFRGHRKQLKGMRKQILKIGAGQYMSGKKGPVGVALVRAASELMTAVDSLGRLIEEEKGKVK